jgi:putative FmdB family regulatory protein
MKRSKRQRRKIEARPRWRESNCQRQGVIIFDFCCVSRLFDGVKEQELPLYEYKCGKCGNRFEKIESLSASEHPKCPKCGAKAERQLSAPAIQFKGSGWYVTDYAGKGSAAKEPGKEGAKEGSKNEGSKGEGSKSESSGDSGPSKSGDNSSGKSGSKSSSSEKSESKSDKASSRKKK